MSEGNIYIMLIKQLNVKNNELRLNLEVAVIKKIIRFLSIKI